jgi:hypothetical protein|tara:strand:+ start:7410 stop:7649 length:240 start_codon:yes stop_codon:yes gene_type:complete
MNKERDIESMNDYHADLIHEDRLARCEHIDWDFTDNIIDIEWIKSGAAIIEVEIKCDFCGLLSSVNALTESNVDFEGTQ